MKVLQCRGKKWYLDKQRIVCSTNDLDSVVLCREQVDKFTMPRSALVMEDYEEAFHTFMGCYTAILKFYESYTEPSRWVWLNRDHENPILEKRFGKEAYIGELNRQDYKGVRKEIHGMGGRCLVLKRDWLIRFRDWLIMSCY